MNRTLFLLVLAAVSISLLAGCTKPQRHLRDSRYRLSPISDPDGGRDQSDIPNSTYPNSTYPNSTLPRGYDNSTYPRRDEPNSTLPRRFDPNSTLPAR